MTDERKIMTDSEWRSLSPESRHEVNMYFNGLQERIATLTRDIETGFMTGAYARLKNLQEAERLVQELRAERDRLMGLGPDMNPGPYRNCSDCGRAMVWSNSGNSPSWMCPNCVQCVRNNLERAAASRNQWVDLLQADIGIKAVAIKVAIALLWNHYPEDVERAFTLEELTAIRDGTAHLVDQSIENILKRALAGEPLIPAAAKPRGDPL